MKIKHEEWEERIRADERRRAKLEDPFVKGMILRLMAERDAALLALSNVAGREATIVWRNQEWPDIEYDDIT